MQAINITAYTEDASQIEAIKAVIKAFKIKYRISKMKDTNYNPEIVTQIKTGNQKEKNVLIEEIKEAVENLKLVREGKLKARSAKDLLNEL